MMVWQIFTFILLGVAFAQIIVFEYRVAKQGRHLKHLIRDYETAMETIILLQKLADKMADFIDADRSDNPEYDEVRNRAEAASEEYLDNY